MLVERRLLKLIIILIAWFILIGYGVSFNKHNNPFEPDQVLALRGISSIEIMIGHIGLATGSVILYPRKQVYYLLASFFCCRDMELHTVQNINLII